MKKIAVFGGSGFLGLYLTEELKRRGYAVTVVDINEPKGPSNFIKCDITNDNDLEEIFSNRYDVVYNLAGLANIDQANSEPLKTIQLNVISNLKFWTYALNIK